jgi:hypothetical protein
MSLSIFFEQSLITSLNLSKLLKLPDFPKQPNMLKLSKISFFLFYNRTKILHGKMVLRQIIIEILSIRYSDLKKSKDSVLVLAESE